MPSVLATLRTRLAALPAAAMPAAGEAAEAATSAWSQGMASATASLDELMDAEAQLAGVFEQVGWDGVLSSFRGGGLSATIVCDLAATQQSTSLQRSPSPPETACQHNPTGAQHLVGGCRP